MAYNPVEAAEALQSIDQQTLNQYMKNPPPGIPAYQVAAEVARRADMAKRFAALQAKERTDQQTGTVIEDVMKALNPGSVNPVPANPSQLASRPIPSNITGANAPTSPPAMQPPVNAGIASGMPTQPALSPQVMQAAGGTMGNTVYARRGGDSRTMGEEVYGPYGAAALREAQKQMKGLNYVAGRERFERDTSESPYRPSPKTMSVIRALAMGAVGKDRKARGGFSPSFQTQFSADGTQGRTVYAQDGKTLEYDPLLDPNATRAQEGQLHDKAVADAYRASQVGRGEFSDLESTLRTFRHENLTNEDRKELKDLAKTLRRNSDQMLENREGFLAVRDYAGTIINKYTPDMNYVSRVQNEKDRQAREEARAIAEQEMENRAISPQTLMEAEQRRFDANRMDRIRQSKELREREQENIRQHNRRRINTAGLFDIEDERQEKLRQAEFASDLGIGDDRKDATGGSELGVDDGKVDDKRKEVPPLIDSGILFANGDEGVDDTREGAYVVEEQPKKITTGVEPTIIEPTNPETSLAANSILSTIEGLNFDPPEIDQAALDKKNKERDEATDAFFEKRFDALATNTSNTKEEIKKVEALAESLKDFSETGKLPKGQRDAMITEWLIRAGAGFLDPYDKDGRLKSFGEHVGESLTTYLEVESDKKKQYLTGLKDSLNSQKTISEMTITANNLESQQRQALMTARLAARQNNDKLAAQALQTATDIRGQQQKAQIAMVNAIINSYAAQAQILTAQKPTAATNELSIRNNIQASKYQEAAALGLDTPEGKAVIDKYFIVQDGKIKIGVNGLPMAKEDAFAPLYTKDPSLRTATATGALTQTGVFNLQSKQSEAAAGAQRALGSLGTFGEQSGKDWDNAKIVLREMYGENYDANDAELLNKLDRKKFLVKYYETIHASEIHPEGALYNQYMRAKEALGIEAHNIRN